mgnify:CR=1 FL=1|jgi:hypothetical protein
MYDKALMEITISPQYRRYSDLFFMVKGLKI